jgi:hypothetical protein
MLSFVFLFKSRKTKSRRSEENLPWAQYANTMQCMHYIPESALPATLVKDPEGHSVHNAFDDRLAPAPRQKIQTMPPHPLVL